MEQPNHPNDPAIGPEPVVPVGEAAPAAAAMARVAPGKRKLPSFLHRVLALDIQTYGAKDGYSVFSALATFAVAEGVALTAVAKGEDREWVVLIIYSAIVLLTAAWISSMLSATRIESGKSVCAFDQPTMRYGRWTMVWTFLLGAIMVLLASLQLLPNQTHRSTFKDVTPRDCDTVYIARKYGNEAGLNSTDALRMRSRAKWIGWLSEKPIVGGSEPQRPADDAAGSRQLVWITQKSAFKGYYKPIRATLVCKDKQFQLNDDKVAFLVSPATTVDPATYRQLEFDEGVDEDGNRILSNDFVIRGADPETYVVIIAKVTITPSTVTNGQANDQAAQLESALKTAFEIQFR